ncbi:MAG: hypothetical protein AB7S38_41175 [Vulcanimicrobiota bacterium]
MFKKTLGVLVAVALALFMAGCDAGSTGDGNEFPPTTFQNNDAPVRLAFQTAVARVAGTTFSPIQVAVLDFDGQVVTTATNPITLALTTPNGATLAGTTTVNAVNGVATFNNLSVNLAGTYTFTATSPGLLSAVSNPFTITPAGGTQVTFTTQPTNTLSGFAINPAVVVEVRDAFGNLIDTAATVTIVFGANPGGATLEGTTTATTVNGVATFNNLRISNAGNGYVLVAAVTGGNGASNPFNVTDVLANGSFETGDYTGWTLQQTGTVAGKTQGITTNGLPIMNGDAVVDFFNMANEANTFQANFFPHTFTSTHGTDLQFVCENQASTARMFQDVAIPANATTLRWQMEYQLGTNFPFDAANEYLRVTVRNTGTDAVLATLFTTDPGAPTQVTPMTQFTADISAFAGQTVRIDFESNTQFDFLGVATDNWRITQ